MLKPAQLINIFKDVSNKTKKSEINHTKLLVLSYIKCSKFPLFRFPGIVDFLKYEDFYPRDLGFFTNLWIF